MPDLLDGPVIDGPRIAGRTPEGDARHTAGFVAVADWKGNEARMQFGLKADDGPKEYGDWSYSAWMLFRTEADAREFERRWNLVERMESDDTPAGATVDLREPDALPTERLDRTAEWKHAEYRDELLVIASSLFQGRYAYGPVTVRDEEMDEAVKFADRLIRRTDKFCRPPAKPVTKPPCDPPCQPPLSANERAYLTWLSQFDAVPPTSFCPDLGPEMSAKCRRMLIGRGLVAAKKWQDSHGYGLTEAGKEWVAGWKAGTLALSDIDGE